MGDYANDAIDRDIHGDWGDYIPPMAWASTSKTCNYTEIKKETDKAYLIELKLASGGTHTTWLPKSNVKVDTQEKTVVIPTWLIKKLQESINKK
jgi:hypothetical protein